MIARFVPRVVLPEVKEVVETSAETRVYRGFVFVEVVCDCNSCRSVTGVDCAADAAIAAVGTIAAITS